MKLIIYCTSSEASTIRDAIQDKYHHLKHSPSDRGQLLARNMDSIASALSTGIRLSTSDQDTITVKL